MSPTERGWHAGPNPAGANDWKNLPRLPDFCPSMQQDHTWAKFPTRPCHGGSELDLIDLQKIKIFHVFHIPTSMNYDPYNNDVSGMLDVSAWKYFSPRRVEL